MKKKNAFRLVKLVVYKSLGTTEEPDKISIIAEGSFKKCFDAMKADVEYEFDDKDIFAKLPKDRDMLLEKKKGFRFPHRLLYAGFSCDIEWRIALAGEPARGLSV